MVTVKQAAKILGVSESRIRHMVAAGQLKRQEIDGRTYGIDSASIADVIAKRREDER